MKYCPKCKDNNILNKLYHLEDNECWFCDECGKLFNNNKIIGEGIKIDDNYYR